MEKKLAKYAVEVYIVLEPQNQYGDKLEGSGGKVNYNGSLDVKDLGALGLFLADIQAAIDKHAH